MHNGSIGGSSWETISYHSSAHPLNMQITHNSVRPKDQPCCGICLKFRISSSKSDPAWMRILACNSSSAADPETCELKRLLFCSLHSQHTKVISDGSHQYQVHYSPPGSTINLLAVPPASISDFRVLFRRLGKGQFILHSNGMFGNTMDCRREK